jgi:ribosomal protein S18 acetylase RimI-like enzyme
MNTPSSQVLSIRLATAADIPAIQQLADKIWWNTYPGMVSDAMITYLLKLLYDPARIIGELERGGHYYLLYSGQQLAAYASCYQEEGEAPHQGRIGKFYIDTDFHGKGLGRYFMNHLLLSYPHQEVRLRVHRRNSNAIAFYHKQSFNIEREVDTDCGEGFVMQDYEMLWQRPAEALFSERLSA